MGFGTLIMTDERISECEDTASETSQNKSEREKNN